MKTLTFLRNFKHLGKIFLPKKLVLNFHSINNLKYLYSLPQSDYKDLITYLKYEMNYHFIFAKDVLSENFNTRRICAITFDDGYKDNLYIYEFMKKEKIPFTIFITTKFINSKLNTFLSINDIKTLYNSKMVEIGSHTVHHFDLTSLNKEDVELELSLSKNFLSSIVNSEIKLFAYPFGSYNGDIINIVKKYYELAFSVYSSYKNEFKFTIPRLDINQQNIKKAQLLIKNILRYRKCFRLA